MLLEKKNGDGALTAHALKSRRGLRLVLCVLIVGVLAGQACAAKWQIMTFTEDRARDMEEFSKFCLLHDVASMDVLWANDCSVEDIVPGRQIYLPQSQTDLLGIWQNRGAWKPKALVQVTSAAAAERARGASGYPPIQKQQPKQPPQPQQPEPAASQQLKQESLPLPQASPKPAPQVVSKPEVPKPAKAPEPKPTLTPAPQVPPKPEAPKQAKAPQPTPKSVPAPQIAPKSETPKPAKAPEPQPAAVAMTPKAETEPVLLLTPDGDSTSGPMRLVISGDAVAIVRLPKSASPKTPSVADLESRFGISLIPGPLPPVDDREPFRNKNQRARANMAYYGLNRGGLIWPVNGAISSYFGRRWNRQHAGVDIPMPPGTPIRAARDGVVVATGDNSTPGFRGYGNFVLMEHGKGFKTLYAHCLGVNVKQGQRVRQGEFIATVGRTGRATTDHLHFEVRINDRAVDPVPYLPNIQTAARR